MIYDVTTVLVCACALVGVLAMAGFALAGFVIEVRNDRLDRAEQAHPAGAQARPTPVRST